VNRLLMIGAGGHGHVVANIALATGNWQALAWLDDNPSVALQLSLPVLGPMGDLAHYRDRFDALVVGLGDPYLRLQWLRQGQALGFKMPVLMHPSASISRYAKLAPGTVVSEHAIIKVGAEIGAGSIINTHAIIGSYCQLAEGVHVAAKSVLSGQVHVGAHTWIGLGVSVLSNISIGADAIVGAGAVVHRPVSSKTVVVGVPAVKQRSIPDAI